MLPWLTQGAGEPTTSILVQYGALGVLVILALEFARRLYKSQEESYKREQARADRLEGELRQLNRDVAEQVVPTLTRATEAITEAIQTVRGQR